LKILNVGSNYRVVGGSDRYFLALEALLERHGHSVVPFAARHPDNRPTPWSEYFPPGVDPDAPRPGDPARFVYSGAARRAMDRILEETRPEMAHLHVYYGQLTASILRPLTRRGLPIVQTLHDAKLACPVRIFVSRGRVCEACRGRHFWRALPRRCNRGSAARTALSVLEAYTSRGLGDADAVTRFVSPSRFLRDRMIEHGVASADRIAVIPNFVDPDAFRAASGPGEHLLFVGRIRAVKGVGTLLRAAAPLRGVPLLIAGTGPERAALQAEAARAGLDHVRFVGFQEGEALHDLIRRSVAVVVPSELYENCPMVILEAMALARPVIGTDMGGIPELVTEGETGWLFPAGDEVALRERLERAVDDREAAAAMGEAGRRRVERDFGPETHYERLSAVYGEVL